MAVGHGHDHDHLLHHHGHDHDHGHGHDHLLHLLHDDHDHGHGHLLLVHHHHHYDDLQHFESHTVQTQPIVPPWSSQAVLKMEQKQPQVVKIFKVITIIFILNIFHKGSKCIDGES